MDDVTEAEYRESAEEELNFAEAQIKEQERIIDEAGAELKVLNQEAERQRKELGLEPLEKEYGELELLMRLINAKHEGVSPRPGFLINRHGNQIEFYFKDSPFYGKYINHWITLYINQEDENDVVGCVIQYPMGVYSYEEVPEEFK